MARKQQAGAEPPVGEKPSPTYLHVAARVDGFRRCGRAWPAAGVVVSAAEFTADDLDRLRAETMLVVVEVTAPQTS